MMKGSFLILNRDLYKAILGIGGLGHLAVQYSKAAGFETIAITHSKDKDKLVRDLRADEVVADKVYVLMDAWY